MNLSVLHPSLRLRWFTSKTSTEQTTNGCIIFEHVYNEYKANMPVETPSEAPPVRTSSNSSFALDILDEVCMVGEFDTTSRTSEKSALQRFYDFEGGVGDRDHPLQWYKVRGSCFYCIRLLITLQTHEKEFSVISKIACDFLAIPATSVSVECLFSKSRHLCTDLRTSMKAETVIEAMCTKAWIREGLLVDFLTLYPADLSIIYLLFINSLYSFICRNCLFIENP